LSLPALSQTDYYVEAFTLPMVETGVGGNGVAVSRDTGKWITSLAYIPQLSYKGDYEGDSNLTVRISRKVWDGKRSYVRLGACFMEKTKAISGYFAISTEFGVKITENVYLGWKHCSTAGITHVNRGTDLLGLSVRVQL